MKFSVALLGVLALSALPQSSGQAPQVISPVGEFTVATADEGGAPLSGTLTIRAAENGQFVGEFVAASGEVVPVRQVASNGRHLMAMVETGVGLAVTWLERQDDGTFAGSWHQLGAGIRVTATRKAAGN